MISGFAYLFFLIVLAITPSLIWLNYYLKKDHRPEPQHKLIITFVMGILITIFVGFLELVINKTNFYKTLDNETRIIVFLLLFPLLEEIGKFLATFLSTRMELVMPAIHKPGGVPARADIGPPIR